MGRFVRAAYYSNFAEKAKTPQQAIQTLAHVMNNFDRPRGLAIDNRLYDGIADIAAPGVTGDWLYSSEYASWTSLIDLNRRQLYVRTYVGLNYMHFDLNELIQKARQKPRSVPLKSVSAGLLDGSSALLAAN